MEAEYQIEIEIVKEKCHDSALWNEAHRKPSPGRPKPHPAASQAWLAGMRDPQACTTRRRARLGHMAQAYSLGMCECMAQALRSMRFTAVHRLVQYIGGFGTISIGLCHDLQASRHVIYVIERWRVLSDKIRRSKMSSTLI